MHLLNYRDMSERAQSWVGRIDHWQDRLHVQRGLGLPRKGLIRLVMPWPAAAAEKPRRGLDKPRAIQYNGLRYQKR